MLHVTTPTSATCRIADANARASDQVLPARNHAQKSDADPASLAFKPTRVEVEPASTPAPVNSAHEDASATSNGSSNDAPDFPSSRFHEYAILLQAHLPRTVHAAEPLPLVQASARQEVRGENPALPVEPVSIPPHRRKQTGRKG